MSDSVEQLVVRSRAGDREASAELVERFYARMFAYLRRLCNHEQDAADLTQRTFVKAWASLPSYEGRASFSTWLHSIAHHVYVDWRRQKNPGQHQEDGWWAACAASGPSPFEDAAEQDAAHQLYALVEQLEEGSRQTVHLHYFQGLSLADTAAVLGLATSTVKYRLRMALDFLRSKFEEPKLRK